MDQAPNHSSPDSGGTSAAPATTGISPDVSAWDDYYKQASRRRRAAGGGDRNLRLEKRRRRIRERLAVVLSAALIGAVTLAFYLVLR
ncbi:MAG TPA: hypothetical protein VKQ32_03435 [Polyangia bacterium]|nr:hypothetical protein [Polyangia bacterium]